MSEEVKPLVDLTFVESPRVEFTDMTVEMREHCLKLAKFVYFARDRGDLLTWKECAQVLKEKFDEAYGGTWHCIVGRNFGSFVTQEAKHCIFFSIGNMKFLLFKHG